MTRLILATPILFAILIGAAISPAYGATKVLDVTVPISFEFDSSGTLCGITSDFHFVDTGQFFIKAWDNNKFKIHEDESVVVTDNNNGGALVLDASFASNNQGDFSSGPRSIQVNADGVCSNGALFSFHEGNTFHRDGTVTDHHISLV